MQILRLLDNEAIDPEETTEAKELIDDYILRNQDDFDEFSDPDDLYADLLDKLDNLEVSWSQTYFIKMPTLYLKP